MKRGEREALEAASKVFTEAGWTCEREHGVVNSKHEILVVTAPCGRRVRFPVSQKPDVGVLIAQRTARKIVRRYAAEHPDLGEETPDV